MEQWILLPRQEGEKPIHLNQAQAEYISREWRNKTTAELRDCNGKLIEVVAKRDYRLKSTENSEDKGKRRWICGHGKPQSMKQGCYFDDFGNRDWKADCNCVTA